MLLVRIHEAILPSVVRQWDMKHFNAHAEIQTLKFIIQTKEKEKRSLKLSD